MADLAKRRVAFAVLAWLKKQSSDEGLDVAMQCLCEHFRIDYEDAQQRAELDLGVNLETMLSEVASRKQLASTSARTSAAAPADTGADEDPSGEKLNEFIAILKQKGYFQGVEEGTPAYQERYEKAKQKFTQRNNPYEGLTADQLKTAGNQKMVSGSYREAVGYYTKAIELDTQNAIYYANRAAAYTHLKEYKKAIIDCERSIALDEKYSKAYSRLGTALFYEGSYAKSVENYAKAVELDPENEGYKADLKAAEEKLKEVEASGGGGAGPLGGNPFDFSNIANVLSNPQFMEMAQNMMKQPQFAQMVSNMASTFGGPGGAGFPGMPPPGQIPDFSQMFGNLAAQQPADGSIPDAVNTPFGQIRREQLEAMQNNPELKENPKIQAIMDDVKANGPLAMMKYMNDPEVMGVMSKLAGQLFGGSAPRDPTP
eukprot:RCo039332